jgi:hypothetical protein
MFFTFPEDARWNAERQAVEFGVVIGEYEGVVLVPRRVFQRLLQERPTPERCVEAYYLQRTRFERVAERKLRRRQLAEDGNVEITGRDLHEGSAAANTRGSRTIAGRLSRD